MCWCTNQANLVFCSCGIDELNCVFLPRGHAFVVTGRPGGGWLFCGFQVAKPPT